MSGVPRVRQPATRAVALCVVAMLLALAACAPLGDSPSPLVAPPTNVVTPQVTVIDAMTPEATEGTASPAPGDPATAAATLALAPPARPAAPAFGGTTAPVPTAASPTASPATIAPEGPPTAPPPSPGTPQAAKVTRDGCCPEPRWLADGSGILFYGTPRAGDNRPGTWVVPRDGGSPQFASALFGDFSADRSLVAYPDGAVTRIARPDGTPVAAVTTDGRRAFLAPTNDRVAWLTPAGDVPQVYPALDPPMRVAVLRFGGEPVVLPPVIRAETLQWFPDGRRVLLNGRDGQGEHPGLSVLNTETGGIAQIVTSSGVEMPLIAPNGAMIAYTATLQPHPANGVFVIDADGGNPRHPSLAGGYRWAPDSGSLLYIPAPSDRPTDELWRYRLADGARTPLVSFEQVSFAVMQDEWELAPDGAAIAYRSASDGAIWVLRFTP